MQHYLTKIQQKLHIQILESVLQTVTLIRFIENSSKVLQLK